MASPYLRFGLLSLGAALALALVLLIVSSPLVAWLVSVNIVAIAFFRYDKSVAGAGRTRVPELVLLSLQAAGGTVGAAIAMWLIRPRHKTQSGGFLAWFFLILLVQLAFALFILFRR